MEARASVTPTPLLAPRSRGSAARHAAGTDFRRFGRRLFRHPDRFAAIRASLPIRRDFWPWHVVNAKAYDAYFLVGDVNHCPCPHEFAAVDSGDDRLNKIPPVATTETSLMRGQVALGQKRTVYSTTSSAIARTPDGIVRPSALAALRLMISSNLVGWATGRSAGFSPLRTRPT